MKRVTLTTHLLLATMVYEKARTCAMWKSSVSKAATLSDGLATVATTLRSSCSRRSEYHIRYSYDQVERLYV